MSTTKLVATVAAVILLLPVMIIAGASGALAALFGGERSDPSPTALADIPTDYLATYRDAARVCPGLDWSVLAAIGKIETDHGRSTLPGVRTGQNTAGAGGPMQFLATTFTGVLARHRIPAGGADPPSRYNLHDAIYAAAFYLCDNGAHHDHLRGAIWAYNHAGWYVTDVLRQADRYADAATTGTGTCTTIRAATKAAMTAINFACGQRGLPYVWGGNGAHDGGFDCSGLTTAAYHAAGITLPRTADTQYRTTPHVPTGHPLQPGDLVFYGTVNHIHHVGLYLGAGTMVNAPDFGQAVKTEPYRYRGDDYVGAGRPTSQPQ